MYSHAVGRVPVHVERLGAHHCVQRVGEYEYLETYNHDN